MTNIPERWQVWHDHVSSPYWSGTTEPNIAQLIEELSAAEAKVCELEAELNDLRCPLTIEAHQHSDSFVKHYCPNLAKVREQAATIERLTKFIQNLRDETLSQSLQWLCDAALTQSAKEEEANRADEAIAENCKHWKNGQCEMCGVPQQFFEVSALFHCAYFAQPAAKEEK